MNNFNEERPRQLLQVNNAKTSKGESLGWLTGVLYLFPYKAFGFNICPMAEKAGCQEACLNTAGRGRFTQIQDARLRKTWLFHNEREWFMEQLSRDIDALERKAQREGLRPAVRLNGTSDLDWENIRHEWNHLDSRSLIERHSMVQFYDYTKAARLPQNNNYHLTFSYSDEPAYRRQVARAERLGMNMAAVFDGEFPELFRGRQVIDGDAHDLRFLDPDGVVVGLTPKGAAKKSKTDFIVRVA